MKRKLIVGIVIVILAAVWIFSSLNDALTPYVSFEEARTMGNRAQVIGSVDRHSVYYDRDSLQLRFDITDETDDRITVIYSGSMPGNFDQATKIVCRGLYSDGRFRADELLLKCPSKYQGDS